MEILLLLSAGLSAGALGAMFGIGGGVLLVPVLVLMLRVPISDAIPASLLCVVANSCAAAASYVEKHLADIRLALSLELATVSGAIAGGLLAAWVSPPLLALTFGFFALYVGGQMLLAREVRHRAAQRRELQPVEPRPVELQPVEPQHLKVGLAGSFVAGSLSSLLGVGGGPLKVPLMAYGMKVPFKVATATSNLMIGVTGAASVAIYAWRGHVVLALVAPLVVGVLIGAWFGARLMILAPTALLKKLFGILLLAVAVQMLMKGGKAL